MRSSACLLSMLVGRADKELMRSALRLMIAILVLASSVRAADAQSKCSRNWPKDGYHLAGQLDGQQIRAFLDLGYPATVADGVSGVFIVPSRWRPGVPDMTAEASLTGVLTADCGLQLTDSNGGSWQLRSTVEGLIGTRQVAPPASKLTLQIVPAMDCTGRGSWRRSAPERWPITFEYPSSWRMAATGDRIVIECPDPARLARGGAPIVFRLGQGRTPAVSADGRRGTRVDRFVTFDATRWLIGETCEEIAPNESNVFCGIARQSEWRGMTVLQGSAGEHRLYRTGAGYVGQGGGIVSYAFLAGNDWVRIDSYDTPAFFDDLGAAGPVLFDGDGVTERLIRSVRRR